MAEFDSGWPLWRFKCGPDNLFINLNDEDSGIALVKIPGINPQGLVDRLAEEVQARSLLGHKDSIRPAINFSRARDLMPPGTEGEADAAALLLEAEFMKVFLAIGQVASDALLANTNKRRTIDASARRLKVYAYEYLQREHTDNNFLTAYLGSTASGHVMQLPDGTEMALSRLPAGYVLYTRQREWCYLFPDFSSAGGIDHKVDYRPSSKEPFRAVGLNFIGK